MPSLFWPLLVTALAIASAVASQPFGAYDFGFDVSRFVRRQSPEPFILRKLAVRADQDLPLRLEIRALEQNRDQWTLYLLGLNMMQYTNQSDPLSWYQITGIHGVPFQSWGGVQPVDGSELSGYCTHLSVLFPTWHRPYVSLYENILYSLIQNIASLWPNTEDRQRYQTAAANFRIPYWDWASNPPAGESTFPRSIGGNPWVDVDGPNGQQRIANPLFSYQFKPLEGPDFLNVSPWDVWPSTVRAPTSNNTAAQSNNTWVEKALNANLVSFQQRLYNLFSNYGNYSTFSNEGWFEDQSNTTYDSLESLHDTIHNIAGGSSGHMAYIPFSAFDPIFFLHHANVDRLFAMWQALYPTSWIEPTPASMISYTTYAGQIQDSKTPLTPFYAKADGTFWTSDMVRDPKVLGYSYAEVAGSSLTGGKANKKVQSRIRSTINKLYGQPSPASLAIKWRGQMGLKPGMHVPRPSSLIDDSGKYREWIANIRVDKQALDGPFFIHFFLDALPNDSSTWAFAPNLAGTMSVWAAPATMPGMWMGNLHITGTVPLTAVLKNKVLKGDLASLEAGVIEPYLKKSLRVGVVRGDGMVVDVRSVSSLRVSVVSGRVRAPVSAEELPAWDGVKSHFDFV